jgi:hypothetical protein
METASIETLRQLLATWESETPYPENDYVLKWVESVNRKRAERGKKLLVLPDPGKLMVPVSNTYGGRHSFREGMACGVLMACTHWRLVRNQGRSQNAV